MKGVKIPQGGRRGAHLCPALTKGSQAWPSVDRSEFTRALRVREFRKYLLKEERKIKLEVGGKEISFGGKGEGFKFPLEGARGLRGKGPGSWKEGAAALEPLKAPMKV